MVGIFSSPDSVLHLNVSYIFCSTVNLPSPSLLFKSEIQMTFLVVCCFVFFEVLFPTQASLPSLLITITSTLGKKTISFVRITARIYGENISESLE